MRAQIIENGNYKTKGRNFNSLVIESGNIDILFLIVEKNHQLEYINIIVDIPSNDTDGKSFDDFDLAIDGYNDLRVIKAIKLAKLFNKLYSWN